MSVKHSNKISPPAVTAEYCNLLQILHACRTIHRSKVPNGHSGPAFLLHVLLWCWVEMAALLWTVLYAFSLYVLSYSMCHVTPVHSRQWFICPHPRRGLWERGIRSERPSQRDPVSLLWDRLETPRQETNLLNRSSSTPTQPINTIMTFPHGAIVTDNLSLM